MSDNEPNIGYLLLAATRDRVPLLDPTTDPVGLADGRSPVWQNEDGVQYLIASGVVTQSQLDTITQMAQDEGWIVPTGAPVPTSNFVGWTYVPFDPDVELLPIMLSWGIAPIPVDDI